MKKLKHSYSRDKRSPVPKSDVVSRVMSGNKAKDTKPEILLRKALWNIGLRGYRVHDRSLPGRPDIAFSKQKLAVFVNGCFWHRCPYCKYQLPKNNTEFWKDKFEKNVLRDRAKIDLLKKMGWKTLTIWECELKRDIQKQLVRINKIYEQKKK